MPKKKNLHSLISALVISSIIIAGCSKTEVPTTAKTSVTNTAKGTVSEEDLTKSAEPAIEAYFTNIGATINDSYKITEKSLNDELEKNPSNYALLDIRKADTYQLGHIKGAVNIPYGPSIADNLDKIRAFAKDKTLIVICDNGQLASQVDSVFNIAGIKTRSLSFGMGTGLNVVGWSSLKLPLDTTPTIIPTLPIVASPNKAIDNAIIKYFKEAPKDCYIINSSILKKALTENPDNYYFIDIRKPEDFTKGHIKDFINIPYGPDIAKDLNTIKEKSRGKIVVVCCYTGQTAGQVDSALNILGISTKSLNFGFGMEGLPKGWNTDNSNQIVK